MDNVVDLLLTRYCDVNVVNNNKITALHIAVTIKSATLVKKLISQPSIEINRQDKAGNTPLHMAVATGDQRIIVELLNHPKTDKNAQNHKGYSALTLAEIYSQTAVIQAFEANAAKANVNLIDNEGNSR